jgi:hypothetical protein
VLVVSRRHALDIAYAIIERRHTRLVGPAAAPMLAKALVAEAERVDKLERELAELRAATTRTVVVDEFNCPHNTEIDPDTGKCGTCGAFVP